MNIQQALMGLLISTVVAKGADLCSVTFKVWTATGQRKDYSITNFGNDAVSASAIVIDGLTATAPCGEYRYRLSPRIKDEIDIESTILLNTRHLIRNITADHFTQLQVTLLPPKIQGKVWGLPEGAGTCWIRFAYYYAVSRNFMSFELSGDRRFSGRLDRVGKYLALVYCGDSLIHMATVNVNYDSNLGIRIPPRQ